MEAGVGRRFLFNSPVKTTVILLERTVSAGETVEIPRDPGFTGTMLLLPP